MELAGRGTAAVLVRGTAAVVEGRPSPILLLAFRRAPATPQSLVVVALAEPQNGTAVVLIQ